MADMAISMGTDNIGVTIDSEKRQKIDDIREAIAEQNEHGLAPSRSSVIDSAIDGWIEENEHYLGED